MADTGTKLTLDNFFEFLQATPASNSLNKIQAMCLIPLFEDLLGGKLKKFALKEKRFWQEFMRKCFPNLDFTKDCGGLSNYTIYAGTADSLPEASSIPDLSVSFDASKDNMMVTPRITGVVFWVAIPTGLMLSRVNNLNFDGDYIDASGFRLQNITINNSQYYLYWLKSRIPFMSTYQIILK